MRLQFPTLVALVILVMTSIGPVALAQPADPHELYEQRCSGCHTDHARDFVQESILREDGKLVGRGGGMDVGAFLARGHGKLTATEVDAMMTHLTSILDAGALFRENCVICHGRAVLFARSQLGIRNGVLLGRYSGHAVADFLKTHGRLETAEIGVVVEALASQVRSSSYRLN